MQNKSRWASVIVLGLIVASCVGISRLSENNTWSCLENSEAVAYARSLTQERLGTLYSDMEKLSIKENVSQRELFDMNFGVNFPEEFADLKVLKIRPREGNILIEGCFDSFVHLTFRGIGYGANHDGPNEIVLSWGEQHLYGEETLWIEK